MLTKFKIHLLSEVTSDSVKSPTYFNISMSLLAVLVLAVWSWWIFRLGFAAWVSGNSTFKTAGVSAAGSPIRYWFSLFGLTTLGAFSADGVVLYLIKAWARFKRMRAAKHMNA